MRSAFNEIDLGPQAREYVVSVLDDGLTLSRLLSEHLSRPDRRFTTLVPLGVNLPLHPDFRAGGIVWPADRDAHIGHAGEGSLPRMTPVSNVDEAFVEMIVQYVDESASRLCLLENRLARPTDPWLTRRSSRIRTLGDEVYHLVCQADDATAVTAAIRESRSVPESVAVLSTFDAP